MECGVEETEENRTKALKFGNTAQKEEIAFGRMCDVGAVKPIVGCSAMPRLLRRLLVKA